MIIHLVLRYRWSHHFVSALGSALDLSVESSESDCQANGQLCYLLDLLQELVVLADLLRAGVVLKETGDTLAEGVVLELLHGKEIALFTQQHDLRHHPLTQLALEKRN